MGFFEKLRRAITENETVKAVTKPLKDAEARTISAIETAARDVAASARDLAEQVVEPEVLDDLGQRAKAAGEAVAKRERALAERAAEAVHTHIGVEVTPETMVKVGRVVVASVVAGGVADVMVDGGSVGAESVGLESTGVEGADVAGGSELSNSSEVPPVVYDGMGNMDGTTTITDGGVSMDFEG